MDTKASLSNVLKDIAIRHGMVNWLYEDGGVLTSNSKVIDALYDAYIAGQSSGQVRRCGDCGGLLPDTH